MRTIFNWKIFFSLLLASLLSILALFPYLLTIQKDLLKALPIPLTTLIILQLLQSAAIFSLAIFTGLLLSKKVGLSLPILEKVIGHRSYHQTLKSVATIAIPIGISAGILIAATDSFFKLFGVTVENSSIQTHVWQRFLASFYGGIAEEVLLRLFLMTLFVWIGFKIKRTKNNTPTVIGVWIAIILAAILFGIGHLPVTATLTALTPLVILRGILLNGIGGILFGWLYWKKGLESAMLAHFTADLMLLIILPFVLSI